MSSERTTASERMLKRGQQHREQKPEREGGGEHLAKIADAISRPEKINRDESGNVTGIGHHHLLCTVCG